MLESAETLNGVKNGEFISVPYGYFDEIFSSEKLNISGLSPDAQTHYMTQMLREEDHQFCLEDITTLTLIHLLKTSNDELTLENVKLGLIWMWNATKNRWIGEGENCAINLVELEALIA